MRARNSERREPIDTTAEVETPEHVRFRYRVAGPTRRAAAYAIDLLIRGALVFALAIMLAIGAVASDDLAGMGVGVWLVVFFFVEWGYYVLSETLMGGRSIGKRALNLRVVKQSGVPLSFMDSVLRNLLRGADALPMAYALGVFVMGRDEYFRRFGDLVAGTLVVSEERHQVRGALQIHPPPSAKELARIPPRPDLSASEVEALELFVSRYGKVAPAREEELAEIVAPVFAKRMGLRYRSAARFLALLYFRATQTTQEALAAAPPSQPGPGQVPAGHPHPPPQQPWGQWGS